MINQKSMLKFLLLASLLLLSGCSATENPVTYTNQPKQESVSSAWQSEITTSGVDTWHNTKLNVTCFSYGGAISCLPDSQLNTK